MQISVIKIVESTTVDGPGLRTTLYAAGCNHRCKGCHNPQSWDINYGTMADIEEVAQRLLATGEDITFSGGDPMFQLEAFTQLASIIKTKSNRNIWCYTGYTFEQLLRNPKALNLLKNIDVLVDGRFVEELKSKDILFRGSSNQRLIDVQKSLKVGEIVIYEPMNLLSPLLMKYKRVDNSSLLTPHS